MERLDHGKLDMSRLWTNPPIRRLAWLLAGFIAAAFIMVGMYTAYSAQQLREEWLDQQISMIGQLSAADPERAGQWAALLANPETLTPENAERGRRLAEEYGLTTALGNRISPVFQAYSPRTFFILAGILLALIAAFGGFLIREYRYQLNNIRKLAVSLEDTVKHNRPMSFRLYGEGELGLLASSVQELAIRLQETIGQLHRDKDFLKDTVADISHQLKTPLASLIIYIDLLREGNLEAAAAEEFLGTCRKELDRMEWLTLTLLKIARLEADALPLQIRPSLMGDTVRLAADSVRRLAEERTVEIRKEASTSDDPVPHDTRWMAEAIANLLKNAVEHSPPGSHVIVGWSATPVFLRLFVQDQGLGIEEKHLSRIFQKFYRVSPGGSGVGLGLPLAKSIVERHGGLLSAIPGSAGGARFVITLPFHPLPSAEIAIPYNTVSEDTVQM